LYRLFNNTAIGDIVTIGAHNTAIGIIQHLVILKQ